VHTNNLGQNILDFMVIKSFKMLTFHLYVLVLNQKTNFEALKMGFRAFEIGFGVVEIGFEAGHGRLDLLSSFKGI
jgi:hypothetical protein